MLATVERFIARYEADGTKQDEIERLLASVSLELARYAGCVWGGVSCFERAERVHTISVPRASIEHVWLPAFPVVTASEVIEALYKNWSDATALTEDDDFTLDYGQGRLSRVGSWLSGHPSLRVTYTAGYTGPDTFDAEGYVPSAWATGTAYSADDECLFDGAIWTAADDIASSTTPPPADLDNWTRKDILLPDDVIEACLQQTAFYWNRRGEIGLVSQGVQGGSMSAYARDELLGGVKKKMNPFRRILG